jgi:periplasmic protein TonB
MTAAALPMRLPAAPLFEQRVWIARAATLALYAIFTYFASHFVMEHEAPANPAPITVTLAEPPPPEAPKPPEIKPAPQPAPQPIARTAAPRPTPQPPISTPVAASPSPAPSPVAVPDLPVSPAVHEIPAKVEAPTVRSDPGAEGRFAQEVRNRIERNKVYPVTARELGMTGTVEVMYVIDRGGGLIRAEIVTSSGYPLLDQAALRAVRSATHAAMPEDAWVGEKQKEFRTKLVFSLDY